ncbi:MAG: hypothetical protein LHV68_08765 [Elusimicrobia bacterium]|nr:hypothetical protein [Candidatus Liberimonas magnetica]
MNQRDKMRELYMQLHGNKDLIIDAYAKAESEGEVQRKRNMKKYGPKAYAKLLFSDGLRKHWILK